MPGSVLVQALACSTFRGLCEAGKRHSEEAPGASDHLEMHWSGHYTAYAVYFTLRLIVVDCALIPDYSGVSLSMYVLLNLCLKCCTPNHIPYVENE